jgi:transposase-like protein
MLQRKLYQKAKEEPNYRFYLLYDKVYREDILHHAYALAKSNQGAPGVDGQSFAGIEAAGLEKWLEGIRNELRAKTYTPQAVRRVKIPKPGGGERPLGIPTIRDRVVQTAAKLVLEPIFEVDFDPNAYGYRPKRSAQDAILARVRRDGQVARFLTVEELFSGRHFDREIVILCVRWYESYKLSYRDLVAMMGERGLAMAHTTIMRWEQHYSPEFQKRWRRFARTVGGSWRMDETYVRVKGAWMYLYRAVDKAGQTVDFFLSRNRDVNAAKAFLRKAMKGQRIPTKITLDAYAASHRAVSDLKQSGELAPRVLVRTSKYLNNMIEQDHRGIKQRLRPMLGLKSYRTAVVVIGGIELAGKIKKGQFKIGKLGGRKATMPELWQAALAA